MRKLGGSRHKLSPSFASDPDVFVLFATKGVRLFSYGSLAVPLFMYLNEIGINDHQVGTLLWLIMVGDLIITMLLTNCADRIGRKRTLAIGALLKLLTGIVFSLSDNFMLLAISGIIGVISISGAEIGPFLSVEQAALTDICERYCDRTEASQSQISEVFGWYNLVGYTSQAMGALFAGFIIDFLKSIGTPQLQAHRYIMYSYAFWGFVKWILYNQLSEEVELPIQQMRKLESTSQCCSYGIRRRQTFKVITILAAIFAIDAFGSGFSVNSFISLWFGKRWAISEGVIGAILMVCNVVASAGGVLSSRLVKRYGAVPTMLLSHMPASFLVMLVPLMPSKTTAFLLLIVRYSLVNMNLSVRQTYIAMLVQSDQRSAAGGICNIARSFGMSFSPLILGMLMDQPIQGFWFSSPFYLGGSIRLFYGLLIWTFDGSIAHRSHSKGPKYSNVLSEQQHQHSSLH